MKKAEKIGYVIGIIIGLAIWLGVIWFVFIELFNRIFRNTGDPFPVLTMLLVFVILIKIQGMKKQFRKILDWISK